MRSTLQLLDPSELLRLPAVERARRILYETDDATLTDQLELVQIPAPSFEEAARGAEFVKRCEAAGLEIIQLDDVGNVLATLPGESVQLQQRDAPDRGAALAARAPIVIAAHLDTVFPQGTELEPRRVGERWYAPGISDNTRGLAALLALGRALVSAGIRTVHPLVFVATVGEEGIGDLRGVKHLFRVDSAWRGAAAFIAVDGTGRRRIVNQAIGSHRLRAVCTGPGGHSWADWGRANPVHALGGAVAQLARLVPPGNGTSTLTVARIGGGTSINTIPPEAWLELDLRSVDRTALLELGEAARATLERAVQEENERSSADSPDLELRIEVVGDRPAGVTAPDTALVAAASAATRLIGEEPVLVASSTDANVPISLGIPAITLGAGGSSGGAHTTEEWYENDDGASGLERLLLTILAVAGVAEPDSP